MKAILRLSLIVFVAIGISNKPAMCQTDYGAIANGDWNNAATWTPATGPPLATDNAFIGSSTPAGSAANATVSLTANEAINSLHLGYTAGTNGMLNLAGNTLTATNIDIGVFAGVGSINHGGGHFETMNFSVFNANTFTFDAADRSANLAIRSGSTVTSADILNVSTAVTVFDQGSQLNLGANLMLTGDLDIRGSGANAAIVDAGGFDITARDIFIGRFSQAGNILNDGAITANRDLFVENNTFTLDANDSVARTVGAGNAGILNLDANSAAQNARVYGGGTINTAATTNLSTGALLTEANSLLDLGANLTLTDDLDIRGTGATAATVNANGFDITARDIFIGRFSQAGDILNDGAITANRDLFVENNTFTLDANDSVAQTVGAGNAGVLNLDAATAAQNARVYGGGTINTVATTNLSTGALLTEANSLLDLGANLTLTDDLDIRGTGATAATVNANGFDITARDIFIGRFSQAGDILNDGAITANRDLIVENNTFTLDANDSVARTVAAGNAGVLNLDAATAAQNARVYGGGTINTVATTNLSTGALLTEANSLLDLGANLTLTDDLDIRGTGATAATVNANGFDITARDIFIGRFSQAGDILNDGAITANRDLIVENNTFTLDANDSVARTVAAGNAGILNLDAATAAQDARVYGGGTINTVASSNLSTSILMTEQGSRLNAGADLVLSGNVDIRGTAANVATLDLQGNDLTADTLFVGRFSAAGELLNDGQVVATNVILDASSLILNGGNDLISNSLQLQANSLLTVQQSLNEMTGLTLDGDTLDLTSVGGGILDLQFDANVLAGLDWGFRWANPIAGDRITALNTLIGNGQITITAPVAVSVFDNGDGYTYVGYNNVVIPEPAGGLVITAFALAGASRRRRFA